jgi:predicted permease
MAAVVTTGVASVVGGAIVGLTAFAAATTDRSGISDRLRGATRATAAPAWRRTRQGLVTTQIAFAVVLLASAALLARSFDDLRRARLGFDPAGRLTFEMSLPYGEEGYSTADRASLFHARTTDALRSMPGLGKAVIGITSTLPLVSQGRPTTMTIVRADGGPPRPAEITAQLANAGYFHAMDIPIVGGRTFQAGDLRRTAPGVIVSARIATRLFGDDNPIGRRIRRIDPNARPDRANEFEVVGVAGDVMGERIEDGIAPILYFPLLRDLDGLPLDDYPLVLSPRNVRYVVQAAGLPSATLIRDALRKVDPGVPAINLRPFTSYVDAATARVRLTMLLLAVASAGALLLGVIGVYSVVAYAAVARAREFGVRLALGASPGRVAAIVLRDGVMLAVFGAVAGTGVALVGTRILRSLLYQVSPTSVVELGAALLVVLGVALVATMIPALKAARTDPALVLRGE